MKELLLDIGFYSFSFASGLIISYSLITGMIVDATGYELSDIFNAAADCRAEHKKCVMVFDFISTEDFLPRRK